VWVDLVGVTEEEARARLVAGARTERAKPSTRPAFPQTRTATGAPRFPSALPPVWNLAHHHNPNFTGREALLDALAQATEGKAAGLCQTIAGLGGVGKTQLAAEFAYRHRGDYDVVWWVRAEKPVTIAQDMADLAVALGLPTDADLDTSAAAARAWLESHDRWLVVFDNAEGPATVADRIPRGGGGVAVVTSAARAGAHWGGCCPWTCLARTSRSRSCYAAVGTATPLPPLPWPETWAGCHWRWSRPGPSWPRAPD